jgi:hypothetical protein
MKTKTYSLLLSCLLLLLNCGSSSSKNGSGFRAMAGYGKGFVAAGSNGRIDHIDLTGNVVRSESFPGMELNCLFTCGTALFAAGEAGALLMSKNGEAFTKIESGTTMNINSLTGFNDYLIAAAGKGIVLIDGEAGFFKQILPELKGNIVSLSANGSVCYGVTDYGEILHSQDLINWDILDFNAFYSGYYEPCRWTAVVVTEQQVAVAGSSENGRPVLFFSSEGNVWTNRSLDYTDTNGMPAYLTEIPNAMVYDVARDRFVLACNRGTVMVIPSCSQCNERHNTGTQKNLTAISVQEEMLAIAGEDYYISTTNNF